MDTAEDRYLDTAETAAFTGFSVRTIEAWRSQRRRAGPPFSIIRGRARYRLSDLRAFMESTRQQVEA
jgi:predicted DNA-binding transcriptional regulator AlpA